MRALQWAARNAGSLATKVVRVGVSLTVILMIEPGN